LWHPRPPGVGGEIMSRSGSGVVVKNTFLEVGDHKSLLERSDGWRRQMSEPVKIYTTETGQDDLSELSESDDEVLLAPSAPSAPPESRAASVVAPPPPLTAGAGVSAVSPPEAACSAGTAQSTTGKPPKVLLLSESIPFKRGGEREREKKGARDGHINQMKDNSITKKEPPWTGVTTVMMRNLPNKYTQQMLLEELQDGGFRLQHDFDFFYLPMDHSNAANLGYCFINFVETALANAFAAAFQGKKMRRFNSNKTVVVMPASVQGYERNYAYYASTRVAQAEDPQYRPLFLRPTSDGSQVAAMPGASQMKAAGKGRGGGKGSSGAGSGRESNKGGGRGCGGCKGGGGGGAGSMPRGQDTGSVGMRKGDWMPAAGIGAGWPAVQGASPVVQRRLCLSCNNECGPTHRFCAFCGADQTSIQQSPSMRADAPTFTPGFTPGFAPAMNAGLPVDGSSAGLGGPLQVPLPNQQGAQEAGSPWQPLSGGMRSPEVITDELDVMRGRMVLLAALRDMEERESMGADASRAPPAANQASRMLMRPPGPGASAGLASREDFLGVLSR